MAGNLGDAGADQPPAIMRRIFHEAFEDDDVAQEVLQITRREIGTRRHRTAGRLGVPQAEKGLIAVVAEPQARITEVMPVLPGSHLVKRVGDGHDIHPRILCQKP